MTWHIPGGGRRASPPQTHTVTLTGNLDHTPERSERVTGQGRAISYVIVDHKHYLNKGHQMAKRPVPKNYNALTDLKLRIGQFVELNQLSLTKGELTDQERSDLEAQNRAYGAVNQLISMIVRKGSIWKGGYLDNTGVVYEDQIQAILDDSKAQDLQDELDGQLRHHLQ